MIRRQEDCCVARRAFRFFRTPSSGRFASAVAVQHVQRLHKNHIQALVQHGHASAARCTTVREPGKIAAV